MARQPRHEGIDLGARAGDHERAREERHEGGHWSDLVTLQASAHSMELILRVVRWGIQVGARHFAQGLVQSPAFHRFVHSTNQYLFHLAPAL